MENIENRSQLLELCYIYSIRNNLEHKRLSCKNKIQYYSRIHYKIKAGNGSENQNKKYKNNLSELNKIILKHRADYVMFQYKLAKHTLKTKKKIKRLTDIVSAQIIYDPFCGLVRKIKLTSKSTNEHQDNFIDEPKIDLLAKEHEANMAIDKILQV